jgi:hypothetical protein
LAAGFLATFLATGAAFLPPALAPPGAAISRKLGWCARRVCATLCITCFVGAAVDLWSSLLGVAFARQPSIRDVPLIFACGNGNSQEYGE